MTNKKLSYNVSFAVDAIRASGKIIDEDTIFLMSLVDDSKITEEQAINKIIKEESLVKIE